MPRMSAYIGPERRKGDEDRRKSTDADSRFFIDAKGIKDRRAVPEIERRERRQDALAGVISGLSGEQILLLRELWEAHEAPPDYAVEEAGDQPAMTYDEIIAREA